MDDHIVVDIDEQNPLLSADDSTEEPKKDYNLVINLKSLKHGQPLQVHVLYTDSVKTLKTKALEMLEESGKHIRLIYQGKLLNQDSASIQDCNIKNNAFVHCAVTTSAPKQTHEDECVDEVINPHERRGFDRFRDRLSTEEIQALRLYFYPEISALLTRLPMIEGESTEDRIYRIEDQWISIQGVNSELNLNLQTQSTEENLQRRTHRPRYVSTNFNPLISENEGTPIDFIWGFIIGLFVGFLLLFWVGERTVPRRQKMGIIAGITVNTLLNLSRLDLLHESD